MNANDQHHRAILQSIAHKAMLERGLLPDFSAEALGELSRIQAPTMKNGAPDDTGGQRSSEHQIRDMRGLLWASIDNDDSRDLDQLTVAEAMPAEKVKILVAIADVAAYVVSQSPAPIASRVASGVARSACLPGGGVAECSSAAEVMTRPTGNPCTASCATGSKRDATRRACRWRQMTIDCSISMRASMTSPA